MRIELGHRRELGPIVHPEDAVIHVRRAAFAQDPERAIDVDGREAERFADHLLRERNGQKAVPSARE